MEERAKLSQKTHSKILELIIAETTYTTSLVPKLQDQRGVPIALMVLLGVACIFGFLFGAVI